MAGAYPVRKIETPTGFPVGARIGVRHPMVYDVKSS
jgi:hypothetical protein